MEFPEATFRRQDAPETCFLVSVGVLCYSQSFYIFPSRCRFSRWLSHRGVWQIYGVRDAKLSPWHKQEKIKATKQPYSKAERECEEAAYSGSVL